VIAWTLNPAQIVVVPDLAAKGFELVGKMIR